MKIKYPIEHPQALTIEEVVESMQTDALKGISSDAATQRSTAFGYNIYDHQKQKSVWVIALLQFKSPIVYLLFFAILVTLYFQDYIESIAILTVIIVNAIIGFTMEMQARRSMNALKKMDVLEARVLRDGKLEVTKSENIVPGDVLLLEAGDVVAADARLIEVNQLQCDESSLTGESLPIEKHIEKVAASAVLGDHFNMVFKGTAITDGNAKAIVTGIAHNTQLGTITSLVESSKESETPLNKKIGVLTKKLIWVTLFMTVIFAVTGLVQGKNWVLILETSIALAVAAFPEGLPIVATIALAYGMLLMAKRNAIVKELSSVETLGSTNVILTDKTGTLTENKIDVDTFSFIASTLKVRIENETLNIVEGNMEQCRAEFEKVRLIGVLCNDAKKKLNRNGQEKQIGDPIEIALLNLADASDVVASVLKKQYKRIDEIPFSSVTKIMGTAHINADGNLVSAKGSVEHLLKKCNQYQIGAEIKTLDEATRKQILSASDHLAAEGLKVLAFAYSTSSKVNSKDFLKELVYVGTIGFLDPPRMEIRDAILQCRQAGIKIVMVTGDHPLTALNIAKKVGLVNDSEENVLTGDQFPDMCHLSKDWTNRILNTAIFARTSPKQKLDIVSVYQAAGNLVAMTGDGVNDAPALKKADIGIAMGLRGTQVAKETANIILKDDSFTSIEHAVAHGREIFRNIQKFVIYLVSCNLSEILIVTALGFLAPASTLLPLQILFLNMVTDVFPALALGLGKGDETVMNRPPRKADRLIVSNKSWVMITIYALTMTFAVIVAIYYCRQFITTDVKVLNNIAFATLAFAQLFHVFNMASFRSGFLVNEITKNKFVWLALLICFVLVALVYAIPQMRLVLGLQLLTIKIWMVIMLASFIPLVLVQAYKFFRFIINRRSL